MFSFSHLTEAVKNDQGQFTAGSNFMQRTPLSDFSTDLFSLEDLLNPEGSSNLFLSHLVSASTCLTNVVPLFDDIETLTLIGQLNQAAKINKPMAERKYLHINCLR